MTNGLTRVLKDVANGTLSIEAAEERLSLSRDLGFACIDTDRMRRCAIPEVIYGPGKNAEQIIQIAQSMSRVGQHVMATRVDKEKADTICAAIPAACYHDRAHAVTLDVTPLPEPTGCVAVVTAGTSDQAVAEEAALTALRMGARVARYFDVGVAGLHRLMQHLEEIRQANTVIVVAGMEGALPSVVGGLIDRPIIGVPTSIGYGTGLNGMTALFAMLNSCVPGLSVVNIDNGFGAGVAAALTNRLIETARQERHETAAS